MLVASGALLLVIVALSARALREAPIEDPNAECSVTAIDCDDTPTTEGESPTPTTGEGGQPLDAADLDALDQEAHGLLGRNESDLPNDVRVGRRGAEAMMLTDDYVLGRMTVELDDTDNNGVFRVVSVILELPSGTETYQLQPG